MIFDDDYFEDKKEYYTMDSFQFENGEVIRDAVVEYMTFGTPKWSNYQCSTLLLGVTWKIFGNK